MKYFKKNERKMKKLNETSYSDFVDIYSIELHAAVRKLKQLRKLFKNQEPTDEQYDELEKSLIVYDKNVLSTIEHWCYSYTTVNNIANFAIENMNRYGTEPQQILNAIDDYYIVFFNNIQDVYENLKHLKKFENFDEEKYDNTVLEARHEGSYFGHVTKENDKYITHGQFGEDNEYENGIELFKYLLEGFQNIFCEGDIYWL